MYNFEKKKTKKEEKKRLTSSEELIASSVSLRVLCVSRVSFFIKNYETLQFVIFYNTPLTSEERDMSRIRLATSVLHFTRDLIRDAAVQFFFSLSGEREREMFFEI